SYIDPQIPPSAPPERLKAAIVAAVGNQLIGDAFNVAAFNVIAIALLTMRVVKSFGIGNRYFGVASAADCQFRVGSLQHAMIQQQRDMGVCRNLKRGG